MRAAAVISIHVPRERDDLGDQVRKVVSKAFQSTSLVRGTTQTTHGIKPRALFQSTSLVRGTTALPHVSMEEIAISIHVPRERDDLRHGLLQVFIPISIHVPRERDDDGAYTGGTDAHISIHVPRERDDRRRSQQRRGRRISIHVPRERDDSKNVAFCNKLTKAICANRSKEEL